MDFDVRVLNATGSRTLANVCWFLRHPVHATRWWLRNGTLYAFIVVPLVVIATACASTGLTVKQAATIGLQSSETALEATQGLERSLCFVNPATESGTHCTNPIAATVHLTDAVHGKFAGFFVSAYTDELKATAALLAWQAGQPAPASVADYQSDIQQILALAQQLDPSAAPLIVKAQAVVTAAAGVATAVGLK